MQRLTGFKFFNVFGPNEYHKGKMSSIIYQMFHQIKEYGKVKLFASNDPRYSDGGQARDFIYVKDLVKVVSDFLFNDHTGIYNVGTGHPRTFNDLARALFRAMEKEIDIEYVPIPDQFAKSYQNYTAAEVSKLQAANPFIPTSIEEGIWDYARNYLLLEERW